MDKSFDIKSIVKRPGFKVEKNEKEFTLANLTRTWKSMVKVSTSIRNKYSKAAI